MSSIPPRALSASGRTLSRRSRPQRSYRQHRIPRSPPASSPLPGLRWPWLPVRVGSNRWTLRCWPRGSRSPPQRSSSQRSPSQRSPPQRSPMCKTSRFPRVSGEIYFHWFIELISLLLTLFIHYLKINRTQNILVKCRSSKCVHLWMMLWHCFSPAILANDILLLKLSLVIQICSSCLMCCLPRCRDGDYSPWEWTPADDSSAGSGPVSGPEAGSHGTSTCNTNQRASGSGEITRSAQQKLYMVKYYVSLHSHEQPAFQSVS